MDTLPNPKKLHLKDQSDTLVAHPPRFPGIRKIHNFCKKNEIPYVTIKAKSVFDAATRVHKELNAHGLTKLIILGDKDQFPSLKYSWEGETGYTDIIYSDPRQDGNLTVVVGRIYGSPTTILAHLTGKYGDSNEAVVFDTTPRRNELPIQALEKLGFFTFLASGFTDATRRMMERAEFILQYSDGTLYDRVHGDISRWFGGRHPRVLLDYRDVEKVTFKWYPIIYSEACYTANFGPLINAFLTQKTVYVGSTTPTYNNSSECDGWKDCHSCDGYKYGLLDQLYSNDTIGEVKLAVDSTLVSTLDRNNSKQYETLLQGKIHDLRSIFLLSSVQNLLFGNPNRPATVGKNVKPLKIKKIPVTSY